MTTITPAVDHQLTSATSQSMTTLGTFTTYRDAQALVDKMSDDKFPVEHVRVVGTDLTTVEQVTGRLTKEKAALYGLGSGAWFGLFVGLLFSLFVPFPGWGLTLLAGVVFGAVAGALFGFVSHLATGGARDFSSIQSLGVGRYEVQVASAYAEKALGYRAVG